MTRNLSIHGWGRGVALGPADAGVGGSASVDAAGLEGLFAKEALASLEGEFAQDNPLDDLAAPTFPGPIAEAFYWSNDDVHAIQGPVGSGKTTTLMKSRLRRAVEMPRSSVDGVRRYKVLFIRETYRQLWSTTIPSYLETFPKELGDWSGGRGDPVTHKIAFDDASGRIEYIAEFMAFGDNIVASMRGVQTTDIVLNEGDTMPDEVLSVGIGRIDRWPARHHFDGYPPEYRSYGQIVVDLNAPDEDNWTFRVFHDAEERTRISGELTDAMQADENARARKEGRTADAVRPIRISFSNQPGYGQDGCENLQNLSPSYYPRQIASMKLAGRGDMVTRLVYNKITYLRVGDPVFSREFNRRVHVAEGRVAADPRVPLRIGLDQGFKGAAVVAQPVGFWRWRILGELHFPKERLMARVFGERLADYLEENWPGHEIEAGWSDMAGEHGASQAADENATWNLLVSQAAGFHIRPQRIGTNRIQPRLEAIRAALEAPMWAGQPGLLIDPVCKFLIRGFEARYVWKDEVNKSGDKRKVPDKSYTEANVMDAGQYLLLSGHTANGLSPYASKLSDKRESGPSGRARGRQSGKVPGLEHHHDILNPRGA